MHRDRLVAALCSLLLLFTTGCGNSSRPSDEAIVTGIQAKMFSDPSLKAAPITVTAKDGVVTLSGQLPSEAARQSAQKIAAAANGVSKIIDQTTIGRQQAAAPVTEPKAPAAPTPRPVRITPPAAMRASLSAKQQRSSDWPLPPVTSTDVIPPTAPEPSPEPGPAPPKAAAAPVPPPAPPAPLKPQPVAITIPEGSVLAVRTVDPIDSSLNRTGETFKASLDSPIVVDDKVVVPKDLNVTLKLVNASEAGRISGRSELTVSLDSFTYQGQRYTVASSDVQEKGASRGKRSAAVIGGGAALGALIGGIAGGGKGAAIGAAAGGAGGTAMQTLTKGEQVKIPAETRLDFTLHAPLTLNYVPGQKTTPPNPDAAPPDGPAAPAPEAAPAPSSTPPTPANSDQPLATSQQPPQR